MRSSCKIALSFVRSTLVTASLDVALTYQEFYKSMACQLKCMIPQGNVNCPDYDRILRDPVTHVFIFFNSTMRYRCGGNQYDFSAHNRRRVDIIYKGAIRPPIGGAPLLCFQRTGGTGDLRKLVDDMDLQSYRSPPELCVELEGGEPLQ